MYITNARVIELAQHQPGTTEAHDLVSLAVRLLEIAKGIDNAEKAGYPWREVDLPCWAWGYDRVGAYGHGQTEEMTRAIDIARRAIRDAKSDRARYER